MFVVGLFAVVFFVYQFISSSLDKETPSEVVNDQYEQMRHDGVPRFESKLIEGEPYVLKPSANHKVLIINFWASWCGPCVDEFPSMIKLVKHFNGKVGLIAISMDSNKKEMLDFLDIFKARRENHFIFVWDPEMKVADQFGTSKLPESYIVTSDLKLIKKVAGSIDWMDPQVLSMIEGLL